MTEADAPGRWQALLSGAFPGAVIGVADDSGRHAGHLPPGAPGRGTHASVSVIWAGFEGLSLPERHRRVYAALGIGGADPALHALQVKARTPDEAARAPRG